MTAILLLVLMAATGTATGYNLPQRTTASENVCTDQMARQAFDDVDHLKDWAAVYHSFKKFAGCDDGGIAEGYSDAVAQLLAKHWNALPDLIRLTSSNRAFKSFVLYHVDATDSYADLKAADRNARLHCPSEAKGLCPAIRSRAEAAMKDINDTD
ncbi:MAG: hypothetical protein ACRD8A_02940 [Candidatus Acidiferrales bacterium]